MIMVVFDAMNWNIIGNEFDTKKKVKILKNMVMVVLTKLREYNYIPAAEAPAALAPAPLGLGSSARRGPVDMAGRR